MAAAAGVGLLVLRAEGAWGAYTVHKVRACVRACVGAGGGRWCVRVHVRACVCVHVHEYV